MRMRMFGGILFTVLVLGALGALGYAIFQSGYQQGLVENTADLAVPAPGVVFYPGWYGLGIFGLFFKVLLFFLIFGFIARLFFWRSRWGGPARWSAHRWKDGTHEYDHPLGNKFVEWHQQEHSKEQPPKPDTDDGS